MAKTKEIRKRIKGVEATRKITKTMELVATSKLKRAQERMQATRPYAKALRQLLLSLSALPSESLPALMRQPGEVKRIAVLLITSNRGLCGSFNSNLVKVARNHYEAETAKGREVDLYVAGKKGISFFKYRKVAMKETFTNFSDKPTFAEAEALAAKFIDLFIKGEVQRVDVIYSRFESASRQVPAVVPVIPVAKAEGAAGPTVDFIFEPEPKVILEELLPLYTKTMFLAGLVESQASEQSARRIAMKAATDNAGDLLKNLKRNYNKARQGQITQELAEIIGGVEALKG